MFILFWVTTGVLAANAFLRPLTAAWELEEDREFFEALAKKQVVVLEFGKHKLAVPLVEAAKWKGIIELDEQLLDELEIGKRRYRLMQEQKGRQL